MFIVSLLITIDLTFPGLIDEMPGIFIVDFYLSTEI